MEGNMEIYSFNELDEIIKKDIFNRISGNRWINEFKEIGINLSMDLIDVIILELDNFSSDMEMNIKIGNKKYKAKIDEELKCVFRDIKNKPSFFFTQELLYNYYRYPNCLDGLNNYVNKSNRYLIKFVSCSKNKNNEHMKIYGYIINNIKGLYEEFGEVIEEIDNIRLEDKSPLLECLIAKSICLQHERDNSNQTSYSTLEVRRELQKLLHDAVEAVVLDKLPNLDIQIINTLSGLTYEGSNCNGSIVFIENDLNIQKNTDRVCFQKKIPITLDECRKIRKILQMSQRSISLYATKNYYWDIRGLTSVEKTDYKFKIKFVGQMKWILEESNKPIVCFEKGKYSIPGLMDDEYDHKAQISNYLECDMVDDKCSKLYELICESKKQSHGALLIFTNTAKDLANRLVECGRGIAIEPIDLFLKKELIYSFTSIDGALIINNNGICYGIGVILDGVAVSHSNIGRGARYNSAYTFIANHVNYDSENEWINNDERLMAVVISEDRTIDIITNHSIITPWIKELEDMYLNQDEDPYLDY
jgi:hypothetical protein